MITPRVQQIDDIQPQTKSWNIVQCPFDIAIKKYLKKSNKSI